MNGFHVLSCVHMYDVINIYKMFSASCNEILIKETVPRGCGKDAICATRSFGTKTAEASTMCSNTIPPVDNFFNFNHLGKKFC